MCSVARGGVDTSGRLRTGSSSSAKRCQTCAIWRRMFRRSPATTVCASSKHSRARRRYVFALLTTTAPLCTLLDKLSPRQDVPTKKEIGSAPPASFARKMFLENCSKPTNPPPSECWEPDSWPRVSHLARNGEWEMWLALAATLLAAVIRFDN
jgi:hypothetical protein